MPPLCPPPSPIFHSRNHAHAISRILASSYTRYRQDLPEMFEFLLLGFIRRHAHAVMHRLMTNIGGRLFFVYHRVLLLSLPSQTVLSAQLVEEYLAVLQHKNAKETRPASWTRAKRDCLWIVLAVTVLASCQFFQLGSAGLAVAGMLSCVCICCCLVCMVLVRSMTRHLINIQGRLDTDVGRTTDIPHDESEALSTTAPTLLSAPTAWRMWAFVTFGFAVASLLCSAVESRAAAAEVAQAILPLRKDNLTLTADVTPQGVTTSSAADTLALCLPVVAVTAIGIWHIGFICVYLPKTGLGDARYSRASEVV
ncbi:hypothetical protein PsYK624_043250 [Phanerochaete sordida]|uniref:Uncharacterized protein n=1 Tax=Phanerochaete sordida TaxID=48140 RepID=A0A9P3LBV9_9APHY|nr:hypothetical protein PsYK624_043250 [Phanerochaete sordida]